MTTTTHSDHDAALIAAKKDIAAESDAAGIKTWRADLFDDPQAAVDLANMAPAQGAGEAVFSVLPDGKTWAFLYF